MFVDSKDSYSIRLQHKYTIERLRDQQSPYNVISFNAHRIIRCCADSHVGVGEVYWSRRCSSLSVFTQYWIVLYDKLRLSAKFKLTNNIYVIHGPIQMESKHYLSLVIGEIKSHGAHQRGGTSPRWHALKKLPTWCFLICFICYFPSIKIFNFNSLKKVYLTICTFT